MRDRVSLADVCKKLVTESFAFRRASDQAGNINKLHGCGDAALWIHQGLDRILSRVGDRYHTSVGFDGAKREVFSINARFGECIK